MRDQRIEQVKRAIRELYAWPGGYPVYTVMSDGALLCAKCAKSEFRQIVRDTKLGFYCWSAAGAEVLWESEAPQYCAHCNAHLESAYGE